MTLFFSDLGSNQKKLTGFGIKAMGLLLTLCWMSQLASAEVLLKGRSENMDYQVELIAEKIGVPWGMAFISRTEIVFSIQSGKVAILKPTNGLITSLSGGPKIFNSGQGGLLDVAVPPGYSAGGWIYFTYSKPEKGLGVTTLARARRDGKRLVEWQDLLKTRSASKTSRHFGSRIAFDDSNNLYFTIGDRGVRSNGQDLTTHAGSILRLNLDGRVPRNNPFVNHPNALPEIWSYGHRNPQGIVFDHKHRRLWAIEHGPRGGDEINLILPGRNYGWPVISYGKEYWGPVQVGEGTAKAGMEQPVKTYIPSIAPGSLILYSGKAFPGWQGNLLAGALVLKHVNRVKLNQSGRAVSEERLLGSLGERIRAITESPEGWLYLSTDSGRILRMRPLDGAKPME